MSSRLGKVVVRTAQRGESGLRSRLAQNGVTHRIQMGQPIPTIFSKPTINSSLPSAPDSRDQFCQLSSIPIAREVSSSKLVHKLGVRFMSTKSSGDANKDVVDNGEKKSTPDVPTEPSTQQSSGPSVVSNVFSFVKAELGHINEVLGTVSTPKRDAKRRLLIPGAKAIGVMDADDLAQLDIVQRAKQYRTMSEKAKAEGMKNYYLEYLNLAEACEAQLQQSATEVAEKKEKKKKVTVNEEGQEVEVEEEEEEGKEGEGDEEGKVSTYKGPKALATSEHGRQTVWGQRIDSLKEAVRGSSILRSLRGVKRTVQTSENEAVQKAREALEKVEDKVADIRETYETSQHPLVWKVRDAQDAIFSESATAHATGKLYAMDATFDLTSLKEDLEEYMIPVVLKAFLTGQTDVIRSACAGEALAGLLALLAERRAKGVTPSSLMLGMQHLSVEDPSLENGVPVIKVSFVMQQVHCMKDKKGKVVEGGESEITNVFYMWTIKREFQNPDFDWRIVKFQFHQQLALV